MLLTPLSTLLPGSTLEQIIILIIILALILALITILTLTWQVSLMMLYLLELNKQDLVKSNQECKRK